MKKLFVSGSFLVMSFFSFSQDDTLFSKTLTELVVTKLDVLSSFDSIKVCTAYEYEGERYEEFPPHQTIFNKCRPVFEELPGWRDDLTSARALDDLLTGDARQHRDGARVGRPGRPDRQACPS